MHEEMDDGRHEGILANRGTRLDVQRRIFGRYVRVV